MWFFWEWAPQTGSYGNGFVAPLPNATRIGKGDGSAWCLMPAVPSTKKCPWPKPVTLRWLLWKPASFLSPQRRNLPAQAGCSLTGECCPLTWAAALGNPKDSGIKGWNHIFPNDINHYLYVKYILYIIDLYIYTNIIYDIYIYIHISCIYIVRKKKQNNCMKL